MRNSLLLATVSAFTLLTGQALAVNTTFIEREALGYNPQQNSNFSGAQFGGDNNHIGIRVARTPEIYDSVNGQPVYSGTIQNNTIQHVQEGSNNRAETRLLDHNGTIKPKRTQLIGNRISTYQKGSSDSIQVDIKAGSNASQIINNNIQVYSEGSQLGGENTTRVNINGAAPASTDTGIQNNRFIAEVRGASNATRQSFEHNTTQQHVTYVARGRGNTFTGLNKGINSGKDNISIYSANLTSNNTDITNTQHGTSNQAAIAGGSNAFSFDRATINTSQGTAAAASSNNTIQGHAGALQIGMSGRSKVDIQQVGAGSNTVTGLAVGLNNGNYQITQTGGNNRTTAFANGISNSTVDIKSNGNENTIYSTFENINGGHAKITATGKSNIQAGLANLGNTTVDIDRTGASTPGSNARIVAIARNVQGGSIKIADSGSDNNFSLFVNGNNQVGGGADLKANGSGNTINAAAFGKGVVTADINGSANIINSTSLDGSANAKIVGNLANINLANTGNGSAAAEINGYANNSIALNHAGNSAAKATISGSSLGGQQNRITATTSRVDGGNITLSSTGESTNLTAYVENVTNVPVDISVNEINNGGNAKGINASVKNVRDGSVILSSTGAHNNIALDMDGNNQSGGRANIKVNGRNNNITAKSRGDGNLLANVIGDSNNVIMSALDGSAELNILNSSSNIVDLENTGSGAIITNINHFGYNNVKVKNSAASAVTVNVNGANNIVDLNNIASAGVTANMNGHYGNINGTFNTAANVTVNHGGITTAPRNVSVIGGSGSVVHNIP